MHNNRDVYKITTALGRSLVRLNFLIKMGVLSGLLLVLATTTAYIAAAPTAHVFLVIGQSNSIGFNWDGRTDEDVPYPNILQTSCCINGNTTDNDHCQLIVANDPLHHFCGPIFLQSSFVGFPMSFARQLRLTIPQDDIIVLVPAGVSGTGFVDNVWTAYTGSGFVQAVQRLRNTFPLIQQAYPTHTATLDAILWHQGEADAEVSTSTDDHLNKNLLPMINAWRDAKLLPQLTAQVPFVVGNLLPVWLNDPEHTGRKPVSTAIALISQIVENSAVTSSFGLQGNDFEGNTTIHFSAKSQRVLGRRFYASWQAAKLNGKL